MLGVDTLGLLPLVPSMGYVTRGGRFIVDLSTNAFKQSDRVAAIVNRVDNRVPTGRRLTQISHGSLETIEKYGIDTYANLKKQPRTIADSEYHHLV